MSDPQATQHDALTVAATPLWTVHEGDARRTDEFLANVASAGKLEGPFLTTTVTSPPYANLVDYGSEGQIGFGQTYEQYLDECERVFADVFKWTKSDGSLWVVADTLMGKRGNGGMSRLIPLPFALAARAELVGWTLREVVIWRKDRTRPWAGPGRLRNAFEYVLFFAKGTGYKHRTERLRDLRSLRSWWVKYPERHNPWGMTPDNVWEIPIPVQGSWASTELRHACPFPEELVRRMVQLSSDEGDVVFDPFSGSGMVAAVGEADGRIPLGTEINPHFRAIYEQVIRPQVVSPRGLDIDVDADDLTGTLLTLRILKYAKVLLRQLMRTGIAREDLIAGFVDADPFDMTPRSNQYGQVRCIVFVTESATDDFISDLRERVDRAKRRAPLSKYSLTVETEIRRTSAGLAELVGAAPIHVYAEGRTWDSSSTVLSADIDEWLTLPRKHKMPPILSSMETHQTLED